MYFSRHVNSLSVILMITLLYSCAPAVQLSEESRSSINVQKVVRDKISKKYGLHCCGGGERCPELFEEFYSAFEVNKTISKDDARQILLEMAAIYNYEINRNEEVRPYLCEYPFPKRGIQLVIFIHNTDWSSVYYPQYGLYSLSNGVLKSAAYDPEKLCARKINEKETIEEALEILDKQGRLSDFVRSQLCSD